MSNQESNSSTGGVAFIELLALLFIGLKLGGVIDWSWWWVTAPLWGQLVFLLLILICLGVALLVCKFFEWRAK